MDCHPKAPKRVVLDFDGSAIETFGLQLNAFYRSGPYQKFMYFPLFVFDDKGWLLVAALRPGDHGEVQLALPVLKRLVKMLRKAWPNVEIVIRADGAFTNSELYRWMDNNRVKYALGLKHNNALLSKTRLGEMKRIRGIDDREQRLKAGKDFHSRRARAFGDFKYKAESWDRERRVIARCDYTDDGLEVRYIVTNITKPVAKHVYEQIYCRRALCEGWIKNMKETNCSRLSCSQFKANAFRLLLHALAYSLINQLQSKFSERISFAQFQRRYIAVSVQICEKRQSVQFKMASSYAHAKEFRRCAKSFGARTTVAA
ncbi:MAG: IS1380 family transposase [Cyanobacteria bacterium REEB67]|nr:IS1380 family transposase [Cyanobacteria bacterium REEB67]